MRYALWHFLAVCLAILAGVAFGLPFGVLAAAVPGYLGAARDLTALWVLVGWASSGATAGWLAYRYLRRSERLPGICPECGYDLRGSPGTSAPGTGSRTSGGETKTCPECGFHGAASSSGGNPAGNAEPFVEASKIAVLRRSRRDLMWTGST
jgi:hypothetical protein